MKKGTPITEMKLISLGFFLHHTDQVTGGNIKVYKFPDKMVYVGIDSREVTNDTRMGLYNTNHTLEDVRAALNE
jgi:hypothetical protein